MEQNNNLEPLKYLNVPELPDYPEPLPPSAKRFILGAGVFFIAAALILCIAAVWPPSGFPSGGVFHIDQDASLSQVAENLYSEHMIKSVFLFKAAVVVFSGERGVKAGDYLFQGPESSPQIAWRLVRGEQGLTPIKVTIPEGWDSRQISALLGKDIPDFATSTFLASATKQEGYLFPDTYFFNDRTTPGGAIQAMRGLFDQKMASLSPEIASSGRATSSVVVMASILEREASSSVDRRVIAGILWKRLDAGEALQVDATLAYALNKDGTKLTSADIATTSPYNTYKRVGLPPTAISNPGLSALLDALNPTATDYWYYISDSKGNIHYAKTFAEQLANENKYL